MKSFFNEAKDLIKEGVNQYICYDFLENVDIDGESYDLLTFLHGYCDEFAIFMANKYSLGIALWIDYDEDIDSCVLVHAFNFIEDIEGIKAYMDIRGVTTNILDIIDEFEEYDGVSIPEFNYFRNINDAIDYLKKLFNNNYKIFYENKLKKISQEFKEYYDINKLNL